LNPFEEIRKPFVNDTERQAGIVVLFHLDEQLQELLVAGQQLARTGAMPDAIREAIGSRPAKRDDAPDDRLRRWITLFRDDVDKAHDVRSRLVHGIVTPDADIKGPCGLAGTSWISLWGISESLSSRRRSREASRPRLAHSGRFLEAWLKKEQLQLA
jgi:hypothetical protein